MKHSLPILPLIALLHTNTHGATAPPAVPPAVTGEASAQAPAQAPAQTPEQAHEQNQKILEDAKKAQAEALARAEEQARTEALAKANDEALALAETVEDKPFPETRPFVIVSGSNETVLLYSDGTDGDKIVHIRLLTGPGKIILTSGSDHIENELTLGKGNYVTVKAHAIKIESIDDTPLVGSYRFEPGFVKPDDAATNTDDTGQQPTDPPLKKKEKAQANTEEQQPVEPVLVLPELQRQ